MTTDRPPKTRLTRIVFESLARRLPMLPFSFYLILAIIVVLLLGLKGFQNLSDPNHIAFTMTVFVIFFAAVVYRAIVDAVEIARKYRQEHDQLLSSVLSRDNLSEVLGQRVAESDDSVDSTNS